MRMLLLCSVLLLFPVPVPRLGRRISREALAGKFLDKGVLVSDIYEHAARTRVTTKVLSQDAAREKLFLQSET